MKIQLVVFDIAGTTVRDDDAVNRCLREALAGFVMVSRAEVNRVMGMPKKIAIRALLESNETNGSRARQELVDSIYEDFQARMLRHYWTAGEVEPMPHAIETFGQLKKASLSLVLDTGFSRAITDAILARLGWKDGLMFEATVTSDEVPRGRPYPDLIQRAMALTGTADPGRVAKVGDTPADLLEGTAAGCGLVIGVTNGTHTREELAAHPHTHLIGDLRELPAIVLSELPVPTGNPGLASNVSLA
ncbi:HAD-superfamily hydrolase, subfamily IA, variant 1 [Verrucomicrobia bacterium]|nr:HAD-superfamily hydrolase, subfamily IA, variant 1 [Verrucomicrobiota bacterium]